MAQVFARHLRIAATKAERHLWSRVRRRQLGGHRFRRQQPIGDYVVDFICLERRLIVEVDGGQHADREVYDAARTRWLESQGFRVLRFWNNDVLARTDAVCEVIRCALMDDPPS
jgi:very-short-patch-repair endonuclease